MTLARAVADAWIDAIGLCSTRAALAWAGAERRLVRRLRGHGQDTELAARFFSLDTDAASGVARQMAATGGRNRLLRRLAMRRGPDAVIPLIDPAATAELARVVGGGQPTVLVMAPQGPRVAIGAALHDLGTPTLLVANVPPQPYTSWGLEVHAPAAGQGLGGGPALKAAVDHLRTGGVVAAAIDGHVGPVITDRPFLGGNVALRPGIAAMARLGRARVIPIAARWTSGPRCLTIVVRPPVAAEPSTGESEEADRAFMAAVGRSIEDLIGDEPGQCDPRFLRVCLGAGPQSNADASDPDR